MTHEDRIDELLDRWENQRDQGVELSLDELCRLCPELTAEVQRRLRHLEQMTWMEKPLALAHQDGVAESNGSPKLKVQLTAGSEPLPDYRLVKPLGRGGYGEVRKAIGPGGVEVALKFVPLSDSAGATEQRALDLIKAIRHPHLLPLFGIWQLDGSLVVAMELADKTLLDRLHEATREGLPGIPLPELLDCLEAAAKGLDHLNGADGSAVNEAPTVQHRDVKPSNLLLVGGAVKVGDFGLARLVHEQATGHSGSMTLAYAAPEFFAGQTSNRSDQYSLAVTYCQLRGGRLPFDGSHAQIVAGHLNGLPDLTTLPVAERSVVGRALARAPEDRWPSCQAFTEALRTATLTEAQPRRQPSGRRAAWVMAGSVLAGLLLIGVVMLSPRIDQSQLQRGKPLTELPGEIACLRGHVGSVGPVVFSRDGRYALSGSGDNTMRLWDLGKGKEIRAFRGHTHAVTGVSFSPDGKQAASTSLDQTVRVWDLDSEEEVQQLGSHGDWGRCIAFAPVGKKVLSGAGGAGYKDFSLRLWNFGDGKGPRILSGHRLPVTSLVFCADGRHALTGCDDGIVRLWNVESGQVVRSFQGHSGEVYAVALSPDDRVALSGGADQTARVWDVGTAKVRTKLVGHTGKVNGVALLPDGKQALTCGVDGMVGLWDVESGKLVWCLNVGVRLNGLAVSRVERKALCGCEDHTIRVFRLP